ncbi:MAG: trehalase family glycosidase [Candidatus Aminicenantes bacterium]
MRKKVKIFLLILIPVMLASTAMFLITDRLSRVPLEKRDYSARIEPEKKNHSSFEGTRVEVPFKITNTGWAVWTSEGANPYLFSYHLMDEKDKMLRYDNRRFPLPQKVKPGQSVHLTVPIISPLEKGAYILEWDMVREGMAWFADHGSKTASTSLLVKQKKWPEDEYTLGLDDGPYTKFRTSIQEFNRIHQLIRITLAENEVEFRGKTGKVCGFSAGKDYPQIWLRDANTTCWAARYFYQEAYILSWLEEHLSFQEKDGSLKDWVDSRGNSDKNTTETDQETSAVQAAYQVFELVGSRWLEKSIQGEKIIHRLERALDFVLSLRLDRETGLLRGAHTPDWGDVDMVDSDSRAVYVDKRTHWTADIYDQSMFYQACLHLVRMLEALGQKKKAEFWENKAQMIRKNTDQRLWQEEKGFYRIHIHLDSLQHDFDEHNMFAMGGNAQAILSGLADQEKSRRIIQESLKRQKKFAVSTISGTLLPPYPKKVFQHPLVDDPYEYQNGGQWDWFGGRLISAMFDQGFSRLATQKLIEILRKNLANRTFYEWDSKDGVGQGSEFFCGSAGSLSKAIWEGYFGVKLGKNRLDLEPRAGKDDARIHLYLPASRTFIAYEYRFHDHPSRITMRYNSNFSGKGRIKILNPWLHKNLKGRDWEKVLKAQIDGQPKDFWLERKNEDQFICVETDFADHLLHIEFLSD